MPPQEIQGSSKGNKLEKIAYYILLISLFLSPLIFWPSIFVSEDMIKSLTIILSVLSSLVLLGAAILKSKTVILPPKSIFYTLMLSGLSVFASSVFSSHPGKSFFGQGFEIGSGSFILIMIVALLAIFMIIEKKPERAIVFYVGLAFSFVILFVHHILRFIFGPGFMDLAFLNNLTSTLIGRWFDLATLGILLSLIAVTALSVLVLSKRAKILYYLLIVISFITTFIVNDMRMWLLAAIVYIGLAVVLILIREKEHNGFSGLMKRMAWIPIVAAAISIIFTFYGSELAGGTISKIKADYSEVSLSWQLTLDITTEMIKNNPILGVGPNSFSKAFLAYKPLSLNNTDAWGIEFNYGFGYLPTLIGTQGLFGFLSWLLFFIFYGILGVKSLKNLPEDDSLKFIIISSFVGSAFLFLSLIFTVPTHTLLFITFILAGVFLGSSVVEKNKAYILSFENTKASGVYSSFIFLLIVMGAVWGLSYVRKGIAMVYFYKGVKEISVNNDPVVADKLFEKSLKLDMSDIYWQARAEATLGIANKIVINAQSKQQTASSTEAIMTELKTLLGKAISYAKNAVAYDPGNYYNYLSEANVSVAAAQLNMKDGYDNAVKAYINAIRINQYNPSIYLNLARLQANYNNLADAKKTIGSAIQVKGNYLDAIFFLSQLEATQGNLENAITAVKVAIQINPENALLHFQLGLLEYNAKNYGASALAMEKAISLQKDYANAKYFLGLSYARLNRVNDAILQFEDLFRTNPDNSEIKLILTNLKSGKSAFAGAEPPVTASPEKRTTLPIKEKK